MSTYSFMSITANLNGPGGNIDLGYGAGSSEEGISIVRADDKNTMVAGADGEIMHSLHAARHGTVTIRLLKTSSTNNLLMDLYNYQTTNPANHGGNVITVIDASSGDDHTCTKCAFRKVPDLSYSKDGNVHEWVFDAGVIDTKLGIYN